MAAKILALNILLIMTVLPVQAQFYAGGGVDFLLPQNKLKEVNQESAGFNLAFESRELCKLWYGLRMDYIDLSKQPDLPEGSAYFENALLISPQVRFNFLFSKCYEQEVIPYLQGMLTISSISGTDGLSRFGFGAAGGAGVSMGFKLLSRCWILDLTALWLAPNSIYRADKRPSIQSVDLGLTLSIGI